MEPDEVRRLVSDIRVSGYQEVVLTGIHLGAYGLDLDPPTTLIDLVKDLESSRSIIRLRLSSLEPNEIDNRLIRCIALSEVICHHLHIPLQSGSARVLQRMNRRYSSTFFHDLIQRLVKEIPDIALGVDVMVGFPGETERDFQETLDLLQRLPVTYLHVFPFSVRPGTPAASFPDRVPGNIAKERSRLLQKLSREKRVRFYNRFVQQTLPVLIESARDKTTGLLKGFSRNYVPVLIAGPNELMNREVEVRITEVNRLEVKGTVPGFIGKVSEVK